MAITVKTGPIINSDIDRFVTREDQFRNVVYFNNIYFAIGWNNTTRVSRNGIDWIQYDIKVQTTLTITPHKFILHNNILYLYGVYNSNTALFKLTINDIDAIYATALFTIQNLPYGTDMRYKVFNDTLYLALDDYGIYKVTSNTAEQIVSADNFKCYDEALYLNIRLDFFVVGHNVVVIQNIPDENNDFINYFGQSECFLKVITIKPDGTTSTINWNTLLGNEFAGYYNANDNTQLRASCNFGIPIFNYGDVMNIHGNNIAFASYAVAGKEGTLATAKSVFIISNDEGNTWKMVPQSLLEVNDNFFTSSVSFIYDDTYVEFSGRNGRRCEYVVHRKYPGSFDLAAEDQYQWVMGSFYATTMWKSYDGFFYGLDNRLNLYKFIKNGVNQAVPQKINIDLFNTTWFNPSVSIKIHAPKVYLRDNLVFILDVYNFLWYSLDNVNFYKVNHKFDIVDMGFKTFSFKDIICAGPMMLVSDTGHIAMR